MSNRRKFLTQLAVLGFAGKVLPGQSPAFVSSLSVSSASPSATSAIAATQKNAQRVLHVGTFEGYHLEQTLHGFEQHTGIKLDMHYFENNEEIISALVRGEHPIDVAMVTEYLLPAVVTMGVLAPLDEKHLPHLQWSALEPRFAPYAKVDGTLYAWPKNWGTTGMVYRQKFINTELKSWPDFFKAMPLAKRHASMPEDKQTVVGTALVACGHSFNDTKPAHLLEAEKLLTQVRPWLRGLETDTENALRNGDWLVMGWSDGAYQIARDLPDTKFVLADDGGELWSDWYAIAKRCQDIDAAHAFFDYMLAPAQVAIEVQQLGVSPADTRVLPLLSPELRNNPIIFPPDANLRRLELSSPNAMREPLRGEIYARFAAALKHR